MRKGSPIAYIDILILGRKGSQQRLDKSRHIRKEPLDQI